MAAGDGERARREPPRHVLVWLARLFAGEPAVMLGTEARGASDAKARRELGWTLRHPSWRQGFAEVYARLAAAATTPRRTPGRDALTEVRPRTEYAEGERLMNGIVAAVSAAVAAGSLFLTAASLLAVAAGAVIFAPFLFGLFLLALVGVFGGLEDRTVHKRDPVLDGKRWRNRS